MNSASASQEEAEPVSRTPHEIPMVVVDPDDEDDDGGLVLELPDGHRILVRGLVDGGVLEVATWRGTGAPDRGASRMLISAHRTGRVSDPSAASQRSVEQSPVPVAGAGAAGPVQRRSGVRQPLFGGRTAEGGVGHERDTEPVRDQTTRNVSFRREPREGSGPLESDAGARGVGSSDGRALRRVARRRWRRRIARLAVGVACFAVLIGLDEIGALRWHRVDGGPSTAIGSIAGGVAVTAPLIVPTSGDPVLIGVDGDGDRTILLVESVGPEVARLRLGLTTLVIDRGEVERVVVVIPWLGRLLPGRD